MLCERVTFRKGIVCGPTTHQRTTIDCGNAAVLASFDDCLCGKRDQEFGDRAWRDACATGKVTDTDGQIYLGQSADDAIRSNPVEPGDRVGPRDARRTVSPLGHQHDRRIGRDHPGPSRGIDETEILGSQRLTHCRTNIVRKKQRRHTGQPFGLTKHRDQRRHRHRTGTPSLDDEGSRRPAWPQHRDGLATFLVRAEPGRLAPEFPAARQQR